ncbi:MAG: copper resistance protein CopC [Armatimonadota bacterium]|nr:copper resistance protein CopC [Armatimonadota bacterium]MDR5697076.1 copper resistance protein CopC [Armatimonadota bacterium]
MSLPSRATPALLAIVITLWVGTPVLAHGILQSANPPNGASLAEPPSRVVLTFSEPVHLTLSSAEVLDPSGAIRSTGHSVSEDGRTITVSLPPLPQGSYTVRWRVLSQVDGHTTSGLLVFGVGEAPAGAVVTGPAPPPPAQVAFRWIGYLAVTLLAGVVFFRRFALQPGAVPTDVEDRLVRLARFAATAVIIGTVAEFGVNASVLVGAPIWTVLRERLLWTLLATTQAGLSVLVRLSMAALLLAPATRPGRVAQLAAVFAVAFLSLVAGLSGGPSGLVSAAHLPHLLLAIGVAIVGAQVALERAREDTADWTPVLAAGVLLFSLTVNAHAWGAGPVAVAADWIHLVAASVWIGGLPCLWVVLRTEAEDAAVHPALARRFSRLAGWSLAVLLVTGAYAAWLHVPDLAALRNSLYGRSLAVKVVLVVGLTALGALNRFWLLPRLGGGVTGPAARKRFVALVGAEGALGAAVLLAVAVLTITPPARTVQRPAERPPLALAGAAGDVHVRLEVAPGTPGWNRFVVTVRDPSGQPVDVDRVLLRLRKLDEDVAPATLVLARTDPGVYAVDGGAVGLPGYWEIEVLLRRTGRADAGTSFPHLAGQIRWASDLDAFRLLRRAQLTIEGLRTWRETEQLTDGASGFVVTRYAFQRPDRARLESADGTTVVLIGATRYLRRPGGAWTRDVLPEPFSARGPAVYMQGVEHATLGREDRCEQEMCRVVLWQTPDGTAAMAAWIGNRTFRVHKLLMAAPSHYMTSRLFDFNAPLTVEAPE